MKNKAAFDSPPWNCVFAAVSKLGVPANNEDTMQDDIKQLL